ncbi:hypothetical protein MBM_07348 [Drepanopeziza brunnea f. sp. 'multigermtubi' MB_m1]|uniref:Uncharacterized protein n=1 Tax=Marssonina brunnea f. sp. multigermtubi (strain MB_m1) TaxID=1072389 RepID=K1WQK1_MARBU|nr:uncharacterized protein MBM_07348 [Drepanopeziza brunnea f. sp. 'multigermtubi' MB_m1]EKD14627.1 hypothetical protein MBM_07348 [Drepanopeziza brunnea f. sp. 'multigermtubi' MB_m1]
MMLLSHSFSLILLALSFLFASAQGREVIGYRTVSRKEGLFINRFKRPFRNPAYDKARLHQLGNGLSMVNIPDGWPAEKNEWYCAIEADMDRINAATKVWIPKHYEEISWTGQRSRKDLWIGDEDAILNYIESMVVAPKEALRFAHILHSSSKKWQMVIPTNMINANDFDMSGRCFGTIKGLEKYSKKIIPWKSWNIIGKPGETSTNPVDDLDGII